MKTILIAGFTLALLTACSSTPRWDRYFGSAVHAAQAEQTINPMAASAAPAQGLDGISAANAMQRYHDASKEPPPVTNVFNIGVGTQQ